MKRLLREPFAFLIATLARWTVRKYRPTVVMVTGSVGKTSTKDAAAAVLGRQRYVRASEKSYNSEFGVPLTILGAANPWVSIAAWSRVLAEGLLLILYRNHYPDTLVLEVGADRPGDLRRILRIATPDAVVVTKLPDVPVHVEAYPTPGAVREEEFTPAYALSPNAPLILCADDPHAKALARPLSAAVTTYGFSESADVRVLESMPLTMDGKLMGMRAILRVEDTDHMLVVQGAIGRPQLLAPAAAVALAVALGMPAAEAVAGASSYTPPPGRGRVLKGAKGSILIDDTYNASPVAVREALDSLALAGDVLPGYRKVAVLGDMLELGRYSRDEHAGIGTYAFGKVDNIIAVGIRSRAIGEAAIEAGMPEDAVHYTTDAVAAATTLVSLIAPNDIVLIKGSQSVRMERIVERLLEDPADAAKLVRQDGQWKRR